jgi:hypothetical protein
MSILNVIGMIPKGGRFAKSVVNFVHKTPQNWEKFKSAIKQIDDLLKQGKLKLDGKQKTNFEANKNILKIHEKVTKKVEVPPSVKKKFPPFNVSKEDFTKGWTPTLVTRSKARNVYKELDPPASKYTKEMEAIDEQLDALVFGSEKYEGLSSVEKATIFKKLQADMKKLIDIAKKEDLTKLSLSQINKKSHDLQRRIREIADNPDIKGTVYKGPKADMIKALYDSENAALTNARKVITKKNSELKYGTKYPVLDPENNAFIITGLDSSGNPIKVGRFMGKFSAERHPITADLTRKEGHSWYDRWDPKKNKMREEGKEVWHETVDREGKTIMSNPEYKLPETPRLDIQTEFYTDLSINDLAKKGFQLKQIDMIKKGREVLKYLKKTENPDVNISRYEQTSSNEIGAVIEDLYNQGDDIYKMTMQEWIKKIPEYFAEGGRTGFHRGSLRHQKEHDWKSYEDEGNFMKYLMLSGDRSKMSSPENWVNRLFNISMEEPERDAMESFMKERFMYGEQDSPPNVFKQLWLDIQKLLDKKRNKHATGGISNLFRERQGFRTGNIAKLPEFLRFVEKLLIKASNEIRQGVGKWKGLTDAQRVTQHDNLTKLATEFQKTKKFDARLNEYTGIDAEKAFIEAQAKVKEKSIFSMTKKEKAARLKKYQDESGIKLSYGDKDKRLIPPGTTEESIDLAILKGNIERKYKGVIDENLLNQILADNNPQRISEVIATIDESLIMQQKGMSPEAIKRALKESWTRKKQASGGLIPGYATGGVSNLFRRR